MPSPVMKAIMAIMKKTPAGVTYATLNPANKGAGITLSGGNLTASTTAVNEQVFSTLSKTSGKWYWEGQVNSGTIVYLGIASSSSSTSVSTGLDASSVGYRSNNGTLMWNSTSTGTYATFTTGDIMGFALDAGASTLALYKNNVLQTTYSYSIGTPVFAAGGGSAAGAAGFTMNFGATALTYAPPATFNSGLYV